MSVGDERRDLIDPIKRGREILEKEPEAMPSKPEPLSFVHTRIPISSV